jgi:hypothetical protein
MEALEYVHHSILRKQPHNDDTHETNICTASEVMARDAVSSSEALPERDIWVIFIFAGCFLRI